MKDKQRIANGVVMACVGSKNISFFIKPLSSAPGMRGCDVVMVEGC